MLSRKGWKGGMGDWEGVVGGGELVQIISYEILKD